MPQKMPYRVNNKITQNFGDGVVKIYAVTDEAAPGYTPAEKRTLKVTLRYQEQRLGINRLYQAKQLQTEIERVIRVPRSRIEVTNRDQAQTENGVVPRSRIEVTNRDQAQTENGVWYRVESVQSADDAYPPSLDIALVRIEQGGVSG